MVGRASCCAVVVLLSAASAASADGSESYQSQQAPDDLTAEVVTRDLDGDAEPETVVLFRDADGNLVRAEADSNGDGVADMWALYTTHEDGRMAAELAIDLTGDGLPDEWRWSLGGVMTLIGRDTRTDGKPDLWTALDAAGAVVEVRGDTNADGNPDTWSTVGAEGATQRTAYDTTGDGRPDRWVNYGDDGVVLSIETDTDGDGEPDEVVREH